MNVSEVTLVLAMPELDYICNALANKPFREVNGLLAKIVNQANSQGAKNGSNGTGDTSGNAAPVQSSGAGVGAASPDGASAGSASGSASAGS